MNAPPKIAIFICVYFVSPVAITKGVKRFSFALFSDLIFIIFCTFFVGFSITRFFFPSAAAALIVSAALSLGVGVLSFFALAKRRRKKAMLLLGENEKKSLSLHLSVCGNAKIKSLFTSALDGAYAAGNGLEDEQNAYYFNFKMAPLSSDDVAAVIRDDTPKAKRIFCNYIAPDAFSLAEDFSIKVSPIGEIYAMLKEKNLLPEKYALGEVKKKGLLKRVKLRFNRRLCPSLFFSGFTLLMFSFFTFYPVYYVVSGAILMVLSAVSLLIGSV